MSLEDRDLLYRLYLKKHVPEDFTYMKWKKLAYWIANSGENKTMFLSNSTRRFVKRAILKTVESPDRTFTQPRDGRRVRIKTFRKAVGEKPYFDKSGTLRKRLLYKVRVVYIYRDRRKVIITAYPEL